MVYDFRRIWIYGLNWDGREMVDLRLWWGGDGWDFGVGLSRDGC